MRNTILLLFSVVTLAPAANAQTYVNFSSFDQTAIESAAGQNFSLLTGSVNFKRTSGTSGTIQSVSGVNTIRLVGGAPTTYTMTFSGLAGHNIFLTDFETMSNLEQSTFTTNGGNWVAADAGNGLYQNITGVGSSSVSFQGLNGVPGPYGQGLEFSSLNATSMNWTLDKGNNGLKIGAEAVPEPSSTALLGLGALVLLVRRRI